MTDSESAAAPLVGRRRLLVVDDDTVILATLEDCLVAAGYEVVLAQSATEAIQAILDPPFGLAIIDVCMPEIDGLTLAGHMRAHSSIPFLFLSVYGEFDLVRSGLQRGAVSYLFKPIDIPGLIQSIEAAILQARDSRGSPT